MKPIRDGSRSAPTFSVIMPVYNRERFVRASIESALAQEYPPHQIVVVDDGSTDRSVAIVEEFGDAVELYRQENRGCAAARNLAIEHATGEYLAFLDSDDIWYPWTLRLVAEAIERHGRPPILATPEIRFDGEAPPQIAHPELPQIRVYADLLAAKRVVGTGILVVRPEVFDDVGGFVPINMNGTDAEMSLRMGGWGPFVEFKQPPMLAYRQHSTNVMKNIDGTFQAVNYMIEQERLGRYPGGIDRQRERTGLIAQMARSMSRRALDFQRTDIAWKLYRSTIGWNLKLGRWSYLLGLPCMMAAKSLKNCFRPRRTSPAAEPATS